MSTPPWGPEQPGMPPGMPGGPYGPSGSSGPGMPSGPYGRPGPSSDETGVAVVAHLAGLVAEVVSAGWLSFVGPLAVWFLYKDRSPFVRACAAGAFNFNLGMWLMGIVAWISLFTLVLIPLALILFGISVVGMFVLHIVAAVKASRGEVFIYPFQLRVLS